MPRYLTILVLSSLLLHPASALAEQGYYLEELLVKRSGEAPAVESSAKTWMTKGKLRREEAGGNVTIVREDRNAMWVLNGADRSYFEIDRAAFERLGQLGLDAVLQGQDAGAQNWFSRTGREKKVGSWKAFEVRADDKPIPGARFTIWLSDSVPIDRNLAHSFGGAFGSANPGARFLAALKELDGYPVEVEIELRAGSTTFSVRQTTLRAEPAEVAQDRFVIPEGYSKVENPFAGLIAPSPAKQ